jgi:hypothetical protein
MRTWIERVEVDRYFGTIVVDQVKAMQRNGWDMTVLIAPSQKEVVVLEFFHGLKSGGKVRGKVGGSNEAHQDEAEAPKP